MTDSFKVFLHNAEELASNVKMSQEASSNELDLSNSILSLVYAFFEKANGTEPPMTEPGDEERANLPAATASYLTDLEDKVDGLDSDLRAAVEVAWAHGAHDWVRRNYPDYAKSGEWP